MKSPASFPTLGQIVSWTAILYACFGVLISILGWFVSTASANILLGILGIHVPGWATGWFFVGISVPVFAVIGAISGLIVYKPIKATLHFFRLKQETAS